VRLLVVLKRKFSGFIVYPTGRSPAEYSWLRLYKYSIESTNINFQLLTV